jgi:hypothetical protein
MTIVDEKFLIDVSNKTRSSLEQVEIGGISEWNVVYSNGQGTEEGILVIALRPMGEDKTKASLTIDDCHKLITLVNNNFDGSDQVASEVNLNQKDEQIVLTMKIQTR